MTTRREIRNEIIEDIVREINNGIEPDEIKIVQKYKVSLVTAKDYIKTALLLKDSDRIVENTENTITWEKFDVV